jgi:hypothetical protein
MKIWSNRKYELVSVTIPASNQEPQFAVRQGDTSTEDWTEFGPFTPTGDVVTDVNLLLTPIADGTNHCLHMYHNMLNAAISQSWTFELEYLSSEPTQKYQEVNQFENRTQFRPFGNCTEWGPFPNADDPYATTDPLDTAMLDLFDKSINNDPFSMSFWIQGRTGQSNANLDRMMLWSGLDQSQIPADGGFTVNFAYGVALQEYGTMWQAANAQGSNNSQFVKWSCSYAQTKLMHIVATSDGTQTGITLYLNGRKMRNDQVSTGAGIGGGAQRPQDDKYYHGRWNWPFGDPNKQPQKTERIQIFDKELSNEDVQELYYNINSARGGAPTVSNLFRDYDFSSIAAGMIPELVAGFDMTIVTGGAQPTNPSFY